ncbi:hypothetical protein V1460_06290 [Streptomyces sp. SCSIO 30461]|uniref:DUF7660 family protein n=1 Tax=Streptomyces sp. SCSIO 30461 TaxID=3118085 RepID=UPI0030CF724D
MAFLKEARLDLNRNPEEWENSSLDAFLEAWAAWLEAMPNWCANRGVETPVEPSWELVGQMVMAARIYE